MCVCVCVCVWLEFHYVILPQTLQKFIHRKKYRNYYKLLCFTLQGVSKNCFLYTFLFCIFQIFFSTSALFLNKRTMCVCVCVCVLHTYLRLTWPLGTLGERWCLRSQDAIPSLHSAPSCVSTGRWRGLKLNTMKSR